MTHQTRHVLDDGTEITVTITGEDDDAVLRSAFRWNNDAERVVRAVLEIVDPRDDREGAGPPPNGSDDEKRC